MRRSPRLAAGLALSALVAVAAVASAAADPAEDILAEARDTCEGFENGVFDAADAVTAVDLDGEGMIDRIIDTSRFTCSSAASMYCGSGGCALHAVIGEDSWSWQATGWRMLDWGPSRILLLGRDGGWCGGAGSQVCFEAINWSFGAPLTVAPPS